MNLHFLFIGDGQTLPEIKNFVQKNKLNNYVTFTGLLEQNESVFYLAACDILASPHVPNPDGSPFFGSPTKLFEYMAMGKAIVASKLDQINTILEDHTNALLLSPGNSEELADSIVQLAENKDLRDQLGASARQTILDHYTWEKHVSKIIDKISLR